MNSIKSSYISLSVFILLHFVLTAHLAVLCNATVLRGRNRVLKKNKKSGKKSDSFTGNDKKSHKGKDKGSKTPETIDRTGSADGGYIPGDDDWLNDPNRVPVLENYPCAPLDRADIQSRATRSQDNCRMNDCSGGCCRVYNELICDTSDSLPYLQCVCNQNTFRTKAPSAVPTTTPTALASDLPSSTPSKAPVVVTTMPSVLTSSAPSGSTSLALSGSPIADRGGTGGGDNTIVVVGNPLLNPAVCENGHSFHSSHPDPLTICTNAGSCKGCCISSLCICVPTVENEIICLPDYPSASPSVLP